MMLPLRRAWTLIGLVLVVAGSAYGRDAHEDFVTWSDFSYVKSIASSMDRVYFVTTAGILRYDKMRGRWEDPMSGSRGIDHRDIRRAWVDEFDDQLVAETSTGLYEYDELFDRWYSIEELPNHAQRQNHPRPSPTMHAPLGSTYSNDGQIIDNAGRVFPLSDVLDDRSGTLWLGTWGYGPARAGAASEMIEMMPCGLVQDRVNTIVLIDNSVLVSGAVVTNGRSGITVFDSEESSFEYIESGLFPDFPAVDVNCLAGNERWIYVGTPQGLLYLDGFSHRVARSYSRRSGLPDDNVISLAAAGDSLFVGTAWGVGLLTNDGDSVRVVGASRFAGATVYDLVVTGGELWIASSNGAYRLNLNSGKLQYLRDPAAMLTGDVFDIEASGDDLWFASRDGVLRLDRSTGDIETFDMILPDRELHAIAANETILAAGSAQGLMLVYHDDERRTRRLFTTDDGLASNRIFSLAIDGDYIWVGSSAGLTRFWWNDPDRID